MRCLWMVAILLAIASQASCQQPAPPMLEAGHALPNCKLASDAEARVAAKAAESYFMNTVGVEIDSMAVGTVSVCQERLVVPIEATTAHSKISRLWFVEIDGNNPKNIHLIRPE